MNFKQALQHNTGWQVLIMIFTFLNNIIIVRLLGVEAGASFFYVIAIYALISTLLRLGLENGIVYYTSKYPERIGPLAVFLSGIVLIQAGISFFILRYIIHEAAAYSLLGSLVFILSNVLIFYLTSFYQVKRMYISINVCGAVIAILQSGALGFFFLSRQNLLIEHGFAKNANDTVLLILAAAGLLQVCFLALYFYRSNPADFSQLKKTPGAEKSIFRYSLMNFAGTVIMFLIMRVDFYFVERFCSATVLGNYVQVAKAGQMALVFPGILGGVIFPYSVNAGSAFSLKVSFFCRTLTKIFLALFIIYLGIGKYLFVWLLGPDFSLVYTGLAGTFIGIYCLSVSMVLISYFEGQNKQGIILSAGAVTLLLILAGDYYFVPVLGYMGAAVVFSAANAVGMMVLIVYFMKKTGLSLFEIFIYHKADRSYFLRDREK